MNLIAIIRKVSRNNVNKIDECAEEKQLYSQVLKAEEVKDLDALKNKVAELEGKIEEVDGEVIVKVPHLAVLELKKFLEDSEEVEPIEESAENEVKEDEVEEENENCNEEVKDLENEDVLKEDISESVKSKGRKSLKRIDESVEYDLPVNADGKVDEELSEKLLESLSNIPNIKAVEEDGFVKITYPKNNEEEILSALYEAFIELGLEVEEEEIEEEEVEKSE